MKQAAIIVGIVLAVTGLAWALLETMDGGKNAPKSKGKDGRIFEDFHSRGSGDGKLKIEDVVVGTGTAAKAGDMVTVHYTGRLATGKKFDSSVDRGEPFKFKLGVGQVIQGWDQGVAGMKEGGKRKLTIPPEMGYGAGGSPPDIPPNAELHFDVELLSVR